MKTQYFQVKVQFEYEDEKGKTKKKNETYIVDAMSVTEAEAKVIKTLKDEEEQDFEVKSASESKITRVI